jgi:HlyD family type I secretion membrane fusion protein
MWTSADIQQFFDAIAMQARYAAASFDPVLSGNLAVRELPFILLVVALAAILILRRRQKVSMRVAGDELRALTRAPRALGYGTALLFFGAVGSWMATAVLASAVVASGVVSPDGYRKTIQHLEGGIVRTIHVREGDKVTAGQLLVTLEAVDAQGRYDEIRERYVHFLAVEARLVAELAGESKLLLPEEVTRLGVERANHIVVGQQELLRSRKATREGRERILHQRTKQIQEEIAGLRKVIDSRATQFSLIDREIDGARQLYEKGLERLPRLLALERAQADIEAGQAVNQAEIARDEQQIGETELQIMTMRQEDREALVEELTKVGATLAEIRSQLPAREDVLTRTAILAPVSGTVMNLHVTTESGVIAGGQPILDIVPSQPRLVIDARVKPADIESVFPDMIARIVLSAYSQRRLPQIHGELQSVSADRLVDERTGEGYFLAKVEVNPAELEALEDVRLTPGMPADVMLLTGEHTVLDYLMTPIFDSLARGFREK